MSAVLPVTLRESLNEAAHQARFGPGDDREQGRPWVLFGSAVLLLHGLREQIGDVDVFVAPELWTTIARPGWSRRQPAPSDPAFLTRNFGGVEVHVFHSWTLKDPEVSSVQCRRAAELVNGWWCTPLQIVRLHKAMSLPKLAGDVRSQKHAIDVAAIDRHVQPGVPCEAVPLLACGSPSFCFERGCQL